MFSLLHMTVALTAAMLTPLIGSDSIQAIDPDPPIPTPALVAEATEPVPVEKPIPNPVAIQNTRACNCYNLLQERFENVPPMHDIITSATSTLGPVAVFMYPPNEEYPSGVPHVALTTGRIQEGSFEIEEYNFIECTHSYRLVPFSDHRLRGFVTL